MTRKMVQLDILVIFETNKSQNLMRPGALLVQHIEMLRESPGVTKGY